MFLSVPFLLPDASRPPPPLSEMVVSTARYKSGWISTVEVIFLETPYDKMIKMIGLEDTFLPLLSL